MRWSRFCLALALVLALAPLLAACAAPPAEEQIETRVENPAEKLLLAGWYYEEIGRAHV